MQPLKMGRYHKKRIYDSTNLMSCVQAVVMHFWWMCVNCVCVCERGSNDLFCVCALRQNAFRIRFEVGSRYCSVVFQTQQFLQTLDQLCSAQPRLQICQLCHILETGRFLKTRLLLLMQQLSNAGKPAFHTSSSSRYSVCLCFPYRSSNERLNIYPSIMSPAPKFPFRGSFL